MNRKLTANKKMTSEIVKRKRRRKNPKIRIENFETDLGLSYWYGKSEFSNLTWAIFDEARNENNIWETKLSSLEYSRQFMCQNWIDTLGEEDRNEAVNIIEGFLVKYSKVFKFFRRLSSSKVKKVPEKLVNIGLSFGFNRSINEDLGLKFDEKLKVSAPVIYFEDFCKVVKSALRHRSPFEYPSRRDFVEALLCNLLKVYVKCVVDAIRKLFMVRIVDGRIQKWERKKGEPQFELKGSATASTENKPETNLGLWIDDKHRIPKMLCTTVESKETPYEKDQNNNCKLKLRNLFYSEHELFHLRYRIFLKDKNLDNIWEENWTRSSFAQRFIGNDWLSTLTENERIYVMEVIDEFLVTHSEVLPFIDHYKTVNVDIAVDTFSYIKVYPAFKHAFIKNFAVSFGNRFNPRNNIMPFGMFRDFMKLVPSTHFELRFGTRTPIRYDEFFHPFISKLLYIQVRCIVDGIRNLFTCRIEEKNVKWKLRVETKECWKYYEDQGWNRMDLETCNIGWTDFGKIGVEEKEDEKCYQFIGL